MNPVMTVLSLFLTGCASGVVAVTPYTSPETEELRAQCLKAGGIWMESQERFQCAPIPGRQGA